MSEKRKLAERIVDRLLTNGFKESGQRLAIKLEVNGRERDLGGWCRSAAVDQVEDILTDEEVPQ